jgi:cobalt-zinc-cadmium efflux system membrane fusion protein
MLRDLRITTQAVESRPGGEGATILGELGVNEGAYGEVGPPISARVVSILAAPGQAVEKGQALVVLQSVELGKARSDYITAQARLELAQKTVARKQKLAADRIIAQREMQEAEAAVRSAEADVRAARAALRALGAGEDDADSSTFTLRSPVSGSVIERTAMQGQMADPAQPLFRVADLSLLWLTVQAFERDAVRVRTGGTARVAFPALPGRTFSGRVTLVGKQVEPVSRTVPVRIEVANRDGLLRPGMSATAWVPLGQPGGRMVTVPTAALQRVQDEWLVFVPRGPDTFEMRPVGRGRDLGGEIEILSGLRPGERIVVEGAFLLKAEAEKARGQGKHEH